MSAGKLKFGIPDVDLSWSSGGTVNPTCFVGHQLLVLFLPTDPEQQAAELGNYEKHKEDFAGRDVWFLVIGRPPTSEGSRTYPTRTAFDRDEIAWNGFAALERPGKAALSREEGAAFLFSRGGALDQVWAGVGHADAVARQIKAIGWLATPSSSPTEPLDLDCE